MMLRMLSFPKTKGGKSQNTNKAADKNVCTRVGEKGVMAAIMLQDKKAHEKKTTWDTKQTGQNVVLFDSPKH